MKSFIVTAVSIITVLTVAEGQNFPVEPGEQPEPTSDDIKFIIPDETEVQTIVEGELNSHSGSENRVSAEDYQPFGENYDFNQQEENIQNERKVNKTTCKAKTPCVLLGGFCVTNATLCRGRLVPSGCKGQNCQCCVPEMDSKLNSLISNIDSKFYSMNSSLVSIANKQGTAEAEITNLEEELQSFKENLTLTVHNIDSNIDSKFSNMNTNIDTNLNNISSSLVSIAEQLPCPEGFIGTWSRPSNQCFKLFTDSKGSWSAARTKCREEGLELAKPTNPVELRQYMSKSFDNNWAWLGGQGTGSSVKWDRDGSTLSSSSSLWWPGQPGSSTSSTHCLYLLTSPSEMSHSPNQPYYMDPCSNAKYPLCELVLE